MSFSAKVTLTATCDKCHRSAIAGYSAGPNLAAVMADDWARRGWSAASGRLGGGVYCPTCTAWERLNEVELEEIALADLLSGRRKRR